MVADGISGLLVIDKPAGITSHDVVDRVRRLFGLKKVGHSGTLDPPATGLLLVGLGKATRLLTFLQALPKSYVTTAIFGLTTSTEDATGDPLEQREVSFSDELMQESLLKLTGEIAQIPPMVSAVRVDGVRLYELARKGIEVKRAPRVVRVFSFELIEYDSATNQGRFVVSCSSGTYVRTLIADLGEMLGCGAHVSSLRRVSIGSFHESESVSLEALGEMDPSVRPGSLLSMLEAMRDFPSLKLDEEQAIAVSHGSFLEGVGVRGGELPMAKGPRSADSPAHHPGMAAGVPVGLVDKDGNLIAVYRRTSRGLKPEVVLV